MEEVLSVRAYPWAELYRYSRADVRALRRLQQVLRGAIEPHRFTHSLAELLGVAVEVRGVELSVERGEAANSVGYVVGFEVEGHRTRIAVEMERALVATLVSGVLGRPCLVTAADAPVDPSLAGAAAAIVAKVVRRSYAGMLLVPVPVEPARAGQSYAHAGPRLRVAVQVGPEVFCVHVAVQLPASEVFPAQPGTDALVRLGSLPLTLGVVGAISSAAAVELASLAVGDIWLPEAGWTVVRSASSGFRGRVLLAPSAGEHAIHGSLTAKDEVVIGTEIRAHLDQELEAFMSQTPSTRTQGTASGPPSDPADCPPSVEPPDSISEAVLDVPLVVRVEVSAVTLTAREWASIGPGDIVPLDRPLGSLVSLRVAGRELARGELVDIDGELGVRIRELSG